MQTKSLRTCEELTTYINSVCESHTTQRLSYLPLVLENESFEEQFADVGKGRDEEMLIVSVPLQPTEHIMVSWSIASAATTQLT